MFPHREHSESLVHRDGTTVGHSRDRGADLILPPPPRSVESGPELRRFHRPYDGLSHLPNFAHLLNNGCQAVECACREGILVQQSPHQSSPARTSGGSPGGISANRTASRLRPRRRGDRPGWRPRLPTRRPCPTPRPGRPSGPKPPIPPRQPPVGRSLVL